MTDVAHTPMPGGVTGSAPSQERVLRRLFLTLFLRGRTSRGMPRGKRKGPPTSIGKRLGVVLGVYAMFGMVALSLVQQPVFVLATYLHAMTFVFLGMYVASSAGEVLFNREEADILLHRPIEPAILIRSRIAMLVQVSLWLAFAFNLAGLVAGIGASDGGLLFPLVHAGSTVLMAIFCTATVVVLYQLCLRWFGREKLDAFMTGTQVVVSIAAVVGGQLVPQFMIRVEGTTLVSVSYWWSALLPPAWFAGIDDALAGSGSASAWRLALLGIAATTGLVWVALVRLAPDYQAGLQTISESSAPQPRRTRHRVVDRLVSVPPLNWWLRDSASRAAFMLCAAYLWRDRDVKLRVYPGIAPILVLPIIFMLPSGSRERALPISGVAFGAAYMALVPMLTLGMLQFSQQWQATDVFRLVPIPGPGALCHGARRAVLLLIAVPAMVIFAGIALLFGASFSQMIMVLPALIAMPVFAMFACLGGRAVPLSHATETHKGASRGFWIMGAMAVAMAISGVATWAQHNGWLVWMLLGESALATLLYVTMRMSVQSVRWASLE